MQAKLAAASGVAPQLKRRPASKHFNDQAAMYSRGEFKDVLFYKEDSLRHLERRYHPGQE